MNLLIGLVIFLMAAMPVDARSGCCSHHGGVCGCGCCDGSGLSATCLPYYPACSGGGAVEQAPIYIPPPPVIPDNPIKEAAIRTTQSQDKPYYAVSYSWKGDYKVSASITKVAGADPGPNIDSGYGFIQFNKIAPGRWYINSKVYDGVVWSKISYWTVDVPGWVDPTPTSTPIPTSTPAPTPTITPTPLISPTPIVHVDDVKGVTTEKKADLLSNLWMFITAALFGKNN